jgi:hypothetical protein
MSKFRLTLTALAVIAFTVLASSSANAQATRTWVSGVGDDVNPCSRTAPCKTYAGAISKTAVNGEISTLDPGGFGAVTITKSITIEGTQGQGYGSILHSGTTGVSIAYDSFSGEALTQRTVRLRNLNINGSGGSGGNASSGLRGIRISGGANSAGSEVYVEDCVIDGSFGNPGRGIEDVRSGGGMLSVLNTTIRNMAGAGISIATASGNAQIKLIVNGSRIHNCLFGIAAGTNTRSVLYDSSFTNNTTGLLVEDVDGAAVNTTTMDVDHCVVSHNTTGFNASTGSTTIRVSNTTAVNNSTALFSAAGGGQVLSYGNNQTGATAFGGPVSPS